MKSLLIILMALFAVQTHAVNFTDNTLNLGTGTGAKRINFRGTPGYLGWDPVSGKITFSNDGSVVKALGSGSGGGAGATSILTNGGFEDGIAIEWSASSGTLAATSAANALIGSISAVFDPAAQNDYLRTGYIPVPKGLRGAACEARFLYTGGDALNYSARVEDQTGNVLGLYNNGLGANVLPAHSIPGYESIFFVCPSEAKIAEAANNGNIRLVIKQETATNAAAMTVDDVHLGALIGLTETVFPDVFSAKVSGDGTVSGENVDFINGNCAKSGTGAYACTFNSGIFTVQPSVTASAVNAAIGRYAHVSGSSASVANILTYSHATDFTIASDLAFNITVVKQGADAKQSVQVYKSIPKVSQNINEFSGYITTTPTVLKQNTEWITSVASSGTNNQVKTLTIPAGIFSNTPNCTCSIFNSNTSADQTCVYSSASTTTSLAFYTTTNGVQSNLGFSVFCQKEAADYKLPTVQPIVIGQVTNSTAETGLSNVRYEACTVLNSGSASVYAPSGTCEGWINSVSRLSAGVVTMSFKAGIFSAPPICVTSAVTGGAQQRTCSAYGADQNGVEVMCKSDTTSTDYNFSVICMGKR